MLLERLVVLLVNNNVFEGLAVMAIGIRELEHVVVVSVLLQ